MTDATPDPADRLARIREQIATEHAKFRPVDHNGHPLPSQVPDPPERSEKEIAR